MRKVCDNYKWAPSSLWVFWEIRFDLAGILKSSALFLPKYRSKFYYGRAMFNVPYMIIIHMRTRSNFLYKSINVPTWKNINCVNSFVIPVSNLIKMKNLPRV